MAEETPADERTEAPTARRRQQATEKGDRLVSRDLATAAAGLAGIGWLWAMGDEVATLLSGVLARGLALEAADIRGFDPMAQGAGLLAGLAVPLAALGVAVLLAAAAGQALSGGAGPTLDPVTPKLERLNPLAGMKRLFGAQGAIELVKSIAKAALLLGGTALLLWQHLPELAALARAAPETAMRQAAGAGLQLLLWLTFGLVVIGAADLPLQLFQWLKRLRMTRQDIKEEYRQQEGAPEVRAALRRAARDAVKRSARAGMAEATVVLTNPTHFAVALRYRPESDPAPLIVARGRGLLAEVIRELAAERQVPVLSYPGVARALYYTGQVGQLVRPDLYAAVAVILAFVLRAGGPGDAEPPPAEPPPGARFDENGRRL